MKKVFIILVAILLNAGLFSCTPEDMAEQEIVVEACCGDGQDIPPPPPPPDE